MLRSARRRGHTLVEMSVAVAVLGVVLGAVGMFQMLGNDQTEALIERSALDSRAQRALNRIVGELTGVGQSLLVPDPNSALGTASLSYRHPVGVDAAGTLSWGPPSQLLFEADPRDPDNGLDDDSDGLVDECQLVLLRVTGPSGPATRTVLCTDVAPTAGSEAINGLDDDADGIVDESGFHVRRTGDLLIIHLSVLEARRKGEPLRADLGACVVLRN